MFHSCVAPQAYYIHSIRAFVKKKSSKTIEHLTCFRTFVKGLRTAPSNFFIHLCRLRHVVAAVAFFCPLNWAPELRLTRRAQVGTGSFKLSSTRSHRGPRGTAALQWPRCQCHVATGPQRLGPSRTRHRYSDTALVAADSTAQVPVTVFEQKNSVSFKFRPVPP